MYLVFRRELGQAIVADEQVGRDMDVGLTSVAAVQYAEAAFVTVPGDGLDGRVVQRAWPGQRWCLRKQLAAEAPQRRRLALGVDLHRTCGIANPAVESVAGRDAVDEGPKTDPLDLAGDPPALRLRGGRLGACRYPMLPMLPCGAIRRAIAPFRWAEAREANTREPAAVIQGARIGSRKA